MMIGIGLQINDSYTLNVVPVRDSDNMIIKGITIGSTLEQNTGLILICRMGEFKESPALGVGIEDVILDNDYLQWRRRIRMNLEQDDQIVNSIVFNSVKSLTIDADYNNG